MGGCAGRPSGTSLSRALEPGALTMADHDDSRLLTTHNELYGLDFGDRKRTAVQPQTRGGRRSTLAKLQASEYTINDTSTKLVAAQLEQRRDSWRQRSVRLEEAFHRTANYTGATNLAKEINRQTAEEVFKEFVIDTLVGRILAIRDSQKTVDASATVVALCKYLNSVYFDVVRGKNPRIMRTFSYFQPHSPICACYFVLDACMAVMEEYLEDIELRLLVEGASSDKNYNHQKHRDSDIKMFETRMRNKLDRFMRDNEYDPFGHICQEEASLVELREDDARGELEALFRIMA